MKPSPPLTALCLHPDLEYVEGVRAARARDRPDAADQPLQQARGVVDVERHGGKLRSRPRRGVFMQLDTGSSSFPSSAAVLAADRTR